MVIVVVWATLLFLGCGLSGRGRPSFVVLAVGAFAVRAPPYMILDLSSPYSGLFRVSSAPLDKVLAVISKK